MASQAWKRINVWSAKGKKKKKKHKIFDEQIFLASNTYKIAGIENENSREACVTSVAICPYYKQVKILLFHKETQTDHFYCML